MSVSEQVVVTCDHVDCDTAITVPLWGPTEERSDRLSRRLTESSWAQLSIIQTNDTTRLIQNCPEHSRELQKFFGVKPQADADFAGIMDAMFGGKGKGFKFGGTHA